MASYKRNSHLSVTPVINGYTDLYKPPFNPDFTATTKFTLTSKYNRRPDLLAYELYGDSNLWWVFVLYNRNQIVNPINDFTTGKTILVPNRDFVSGLQ